MRIIAGAARGINLETPKGLAVRPTAGRSRKALFDSLGDFDGLTVLDLCAGSGALGLEALSRGAAEAVLIERDRRHAALIEKNAAAVAKAGASGRVRVVNGDVRDSRSWRGVRPDLIFADPPYAESIVFFRDLMADERFRNETAGSLVVWEIPDAPGSLGPFLESSKLVDQVVRNFGGTEFLIGFMPEKGGVS